MSRVFKRPQALRDLAEIWSYIADDSETQADRFLEGLDKSLALWATQPSMGRRRDELVAGLRSLPHGRYVVFALPHPDGIEVVRVLHAARDLSSEHFDSQAIG